MKHIEAMSKTPSVAQTTITLKLNATIDIVDRLLLAQRQVQWKVPFPIDGETDTTTTTTVDTTDIPFL